MSATTVVASSTKSFEAGRDDSQISSSTTPSMSDGPDSSWSVSSLTPVQTSAGRPQPPMRPLLEPTLAEMKQTLEAVSVAPLFPPSQQRNALSAWRTAEWPATMTLQEQLHASIIGVDVLAHEDMRATNSDSDANANAAPIIAPAADAVTADQVEHAGEFHPPPHYPDITVLDVQRSMVVTAGPCTSKIWVAHRSFDSVKDAIAKTSFTETSILRHHLDVVYPAIREMWLCSLIRDTLAASASNLARDVRVWTPTRVRFSSLAVAIQGPRSTAMSLTHVMQTCARIIKTAQAHHPVRDPAHYGPAGQIAYKICFRESYETFDIRALFAWLRMDVLPKICAAVSVLCGAGIAHGDLKLPNILIDHEDLAVVLIDPGNAAVFHDEHELHAAFTRFVNTCISDQTAAPLLDTNGPASTSDTNATAAVEIDKGVQPMDWQSGQKRQTSDHSSGSDRRRSARLLQQRGGGRHPCAVTKYDIPVPAATKSGRNALPLPLPQTLLPPPPSDAHNLFCFETLQPDFEEQQQQQQQSGATAGDLLPSAMEASAIQWPSTAVSIQGTLNRKQWIDYASLLSVGSTYNDMVRMRLHRQQQRPGTRRSPEDSPNCNTTIASNRPRTGKRKRCVETWTAATVASDAAATTAGGDNAGDDVFSDKRRRMAYTAGNLVSMMEYAARHDNDGDYNCVQLPADLAGVVRGIPGFTTAVQAFATDNRELLHFTCDATHERNCWHHYSNFYARECAWEYTIASLILQRILRLPGDTQCVMNTSIEMLLQGCPQVDVATLLDLCVLTVDLVHRLCAILHLCVSNDNRTQDGFARVIYPIFDSTKLVMRRLIRKV